MDRYALLIGISKYHDSFEPLNSPENDVQIMAKLLEEKGDFVPEGLLGEDAACFDIETYEADDLQYVRARIDEAFGQAAGR